MSDYFDWSRPPDREDDDANEEKGLKEEGDGTEEVGWPSYERPRYEPPRYDEPAPEDPKYQEPTYEQPTYDQPSRSTTPAEPDSEPAWRRAEHSYGDYGRYGETPSPRDRFSEEAIKARYPEFPEKRSRDPLAKLFPGLPHGVRVTLDWILTIAGAILIVLALKQWVVNPYRIPSSSMEPTLHCARGVTEPGCLGGSSDRVLACRICLDFGPPSRGDIVVFNTPAAAKSNCGEGGTFVKRVIGLPGETVREDDKGFILIRGPDSKTWTKLDEPYISASARLQDRTHFNKTWPAGPGYFMMGDNRSQSCDSRTWGRVPRGDLIGTVFFIYWPPDRIGFR
jgi:signal peptidase I